MENNQIKLYTNPTIYELLANIQKKAKVAKNNKNAFGKYNYRNLEDILNIVKPLCCDAGLVLTITDELQEVAGRLFVKATATVTHTDNSSISASAYAQHASNKKGCDEAQLTGLTSSYARKYACQGLFAIDDGIDNDAINDVPQEAYSKTAIPYNAQRILKTVNSLYTLEALKVYAQQTKTKYPEHNQEIIDICKARSEEIKKEESKRRVNNA
jgi:hypothetical protein